MFLILLKFSTNKARAPEVMADHVAWLKQGFDDGVFDLAGSLQPQLGGGILAPPLAPRSRPASPPTPL